MPVMKRDREEHEFGTRGSASQLVSMFESFRDELDEHHDKRDRVGKASRDITALSKKIIFALQRAQALKQAIPSTIATENEERFSAIVKLFKSVSPDLQGINAWRYQRQISSGLQEYIEATALEHYLRFQSLLTHEEASRSVPAGIQLCLDDYLLGICDFVGELMRFAITIMATQGSLPLSKDDNSINERTILMDMRSLRTLFESLDTASYDGTGLGKDVEKKMDVMRACVEKVETILYGMTIRGRERPQGWVPGFPEDRPSVESY